MVTRLIAYTKARQGNDPKKSIVNNVPASISNDKIIDYIGGRTNTKFEIELAKLK
jgi:hypothetical protein